MYNLEITKNELDTILVALRDSEERLRQQLTKLNFCYSDLPDNFKFMWKDKTSYEKYSEDAKKECFRQLKEISILQEKLEEL